MVFYRLCRLPILRRCGKLIFKHSAPRGSNPAGGNEKGEMKMKQKLSGREYTYVASMLFGMFFGAGNLIFPVHMGQMAGANVWPAVIGFCVTGVGLPLLGVAALGISRSGGLFELGSRAGAPTHVLHLPALPDHRAVLRHPPLRHHLLHRGTGAGAAAGRQYAALPAGVLRRLLRRGAVLCCRLARSSSGSARCSTPASCCSSAFWSSWRCSAPAPPSARSYRRALTPLSLSSPASSRATTPWTRWQVPCLRHRGRAGHP